MLIPAKARQIVYLNIQIVELNTAAKSSSNKNKNFKKSG
jgi:hypothetical protein